MKAPSRRRTADSLASLTTGLGTTKDRATQTYWAFTVLTDEQIDAAYRGDWLARKIIDLIPYDMTREWRTWNADDAQITALETAERDLQVRPKLLEALVLSRKYGGSALLIGDGAGDPATELDVTRIGKGGIKYLHALPRQVLTFSEMDTDLQSRFFGLPKILEYQPSTGIPISIHPSRFVFFRGMPRYTGRPVTAQDEFWGDSILQSIQDQVKAANTIHQGVSNLVQEAKVDVITVPSLSSHLTDDTATQALTARFAYANMLKSLFNMLLIGDGEEWDRKEVNFSMMPELARMFLQFAAGAADIPLTRLIGQSPAGLNATGESDTRNYYDMISSRQEADLTPQINQLDEALIRHALGNRPDSLWYIWNPLWQLSGKELAETQKLRAERDQIYANAALIPDEALAEAVQSALVDDGTYPALEEALAKQPDPFAVEPREAQMLGRMQEFEAERQQATDASPKSLYVSRRLKSGGRLLEHFARQGVVNGNGVKVLEPEDLHVTITYSRNAVDWMLMGQSWQADLDIPKGGPRVVEKLGDAIVLMFASSELSWRHEEMKRAGASWGHENYQPHVTIAYDPEGKIDVAALKPYTGALRFGEEVFEMVNENWKEEMME